MEQVIHNHAVLFMYQLPKTRPHLGTRTGRVNAVRIDERECLSHMSACQCRVHAAWRPPILNHSTLV